MIIITLRLTAQHAADIKNPTPSTMEQLGTPNSDGNDYTGQYPTPTKTKVQPTCLPAYLPTYG